jgi:rhodanese-related sulfurtransferase
MAKDIEPRAVAEALRQGDVQLVDVREDHEWQAGHIAGARHIALGEVAAQADTLDPNRPVVFYCRSGGRSTMAADAFAQAGFDAASMEGGMLEWEREGLPMEPEDGHVAEH